MALERVDPIAYLLGRVFGLPIGIEHDLGILSLGARRQPRSRAASSPGGIGWGRGVAPAISWLPRGFVLHARIPTPHVREPTSRSGGQHRRQPDPATMATTTGETDTRPFGRGIASLPLTERSRDEPSRTGDEPSRAGDEAAEGADDRAGEAQEEDDPDAPGLGIVHDDELDDLPEPNEPG